MQTGEDQLTDGRLAVQFFLQMVIISMHIAGSSSRSLCLHVSLNTWLAQEGLQRVYICKRPWHPDSAECAC